MTLIDLANPTRFLSLTGRALPWLAGATAILLAIGLYQAAMAPDDYQQGATAKIMFVHVPNAWLAMFVWGVMSLAALGTLVASAQGVGEALARHCIDRFRESGAVAVVLSSTPGMADAHRLYERLGFRRLPERDWQPVPGVQLWAFRKDFDE